MDNGTTSLTLKRLHQELLQVQAELGVLKAINGVTDFWVPLQDVESYLGVPYRKLYDEIRLAEDGKLKDMRYGEHYRNDAQLGAKRAVWKVNLPKYQELLKIPPEHRRLSA